MLKMNERINLIHSLKKCSLGLELLQEFEPDTLSQFCGSLEEKQIPQSRYAKCPEIQKELINHEQFFFYLDRINAEITPPSMVNSFLETLHSKGKSAVDYDIEHFISGMELAADAPEVFYDYLANFSSFISSQEERIVVKKNLKLYQKYLSTPIRELPVKEMALFMDEALTDRWMMPELEHVDRALKLLARNKGLLEIIRFLYTNGIRVEMNIGNYESLCHHSNWILEKLQVLHELLGEGEIRHFMQRWLENNCPLYDLEILSKSIADLDENSRGDILYSRSGYINHIYGGRIKSIQLSEVHRHKEDILIYAITNKKSAFIRLVEENYEAFSSLSTGSLLFKREFYAKHININSLSAKNLNDCGWMEASKLNFGELEADRIYTFEEIKALYGLSIRYYKLYAALEIPSIDKRLLVLRQISKRKLLESMTEDEYVTKLAVKLSEQPLLWWIEKHLSHINGLKPQDAVNLLIHWEKVRKLIPQMTVKADVQLVVRNPDNAVNYGTLTTLKSDLIKTDPAWAELVREMKFSDEFISQYAENAIDFLAQNGGDITRTYLAGLYEDKQRESLKRIVKAVLMGEFNTLKYYADDLHKELEYPVTNAHKSVWMENTELQGKFDIVVRECDDFYSTLLLSKIPQSTCLAYDGGTRKDCLLSGFDSNKKVLFAYCGDEVVGRAIVRLTKGRFDNPDKPIEPSLSFVDVETIDRGSVNGSNNARTQKAGQEHLIIFLERPYSADVPGKTAGYIEGLYAELLAKKARAMGALLVVSNKYNQISLEDFVRTEYHVFISKSKAGAQYLDSLNGAASISDEGGYKSNCFYIHKNALLH